MFVSLMLVSTRPPTGSYTKYSFCVLWVGPHRRYSRAFVFIVFHIHVVAYIQQTLFVEQTL